MTRLDGLPSDEPFAIPAIRAVPVSSESSWLAIYEVSTVRTGLDHNSNCDDQYAGGGPDTPTAPIYQEGSHVPWDRAGIHRSVGTTTSTSPHTTFPA